MKTKQSKLGSKLLEVQLIIADCNEIENWQENGHHFRKK